MTVEAASAPAEGTQAEGQEAQGQEGAEQQEQQAPAQPDFDALREQTREMFRDELGRFAAANQPEPPPEPDYLAEQFRDLASSDDVPPEQALAVIEQLAERKAEERMGPLAQQVQQMRMEREADQLFAEIPELKDEQNLNKAFDSAFTLALALSGGDEQVAEQLANEPKLIRAAYLADAASQRATAEQAGGAQQQEVDLESAGAAAQGGAEDQDDELRRSILGAGKQGESNPYLTG